MSSENTSENLAMSASGQGTGVTKLIHLTGGSSSRLSSFGRAMAGILPPVKKIQLNHLQPKMLHMFPSVLYRKEVANRAGVKVGSDDVTDSAILPRTCDRTLSCSEADGNGKENLKVYSELMSSSESDLSNSELDLCSRGHDVHFLLRSTGLLTVTPQQVVVALLKNKVRSLGQNGLEEVGGDVDDESNVDGRIGLLDRKKAILVAQQVKARSLDIEERAGKMKPCPATTEVEDVVYRKVILGDTCEKRLGIIEQDFATSGENVAEMESSQKLVQPNTDAKLPKAAPAIVVNDREIAGHQPLVRRQSQLKISYSEGSLSNSLNASQENVTIDLDELDLFDSQGSGGSALNKLRFKVANLALPTMAMPVSRQRQLREQAKNNLLRSQLRFKELKTRVILL